MGKRAGLKYAALQRLDGLMADGQKRSEAKAQAALRGEDTFAFTDGKMHSFQTRTTYQQIIMRFLDWCRERYDIRDHDVLIQQADELASVYLSERVEAGYSAWTLQTERSALRMYFEDRTLAEDVPLPQRKRSNIKRSRKPVKRDAHFQPEHWPQLVQFLQACGLRREELRDLHVGDIFYTTEGQLVVHVRNGKGGRERKVPVFPGREQAVLAVTEGRPQEEHIFERLPVAIDIHAYRRRFAQELYEHRSGRPLPPVEGRLCAADFDRQAAEYVSWCLGHNRVEVIFGSYIR
jgi:integrase